MQSWKRLPERITGRYRSRFLTVVTLIFVQGFAIPNPGWQRPPVFFTPLRIFPLTPQCLVTIINKKAQLQLAYSLLNPF